MSDDEYQQARIDALEKQFASVLESLEALAKFPGFQPLNFEGEDHHGDGGVSRAVHRHVFAFQSNVKSIFSENLQAYLEKIYNLLPHHTIDEALEVDLDRLKLQFFYDPENHNASHVAVAINKGTGHMIALHGDVSKQNFLRGVYDCKLSEGPLVPELGLEPYYNIARILGLLDPLVEEAERMNAEDQYYDCRALWEKRVKIIKPELIDVEYMRFQKDVITAARALRGVQGSADVSTNSMDYGM